MYRLLPRHVPGVTQQLFMDSAYSSGLHYAEVADLGVRLYILLTDEIFSALE